MLRLRAPAALARGRALPRVRRLRGDPGRARRHPTPSAAVSLQGVRRALRRPHRHRAGRSPPALGRVGAVPLLPGPECVEPADRGRVGPVSVRRPGHDGATAPRARGQSPGRGTDGRSRDRRGLRGGGPQGPARGRGRTGAARTPAQAGRRAGTGHGGEGQAARPGPDPARGGEVVLRMLPDVRQRTIEPIITGAVAQGALIHTDEYAIYARLPAWGYRHKTVCHGRGEYARDEDGDGFCEVHVNTIEGFWSLLRSWLRPHRGLSQEKLPLYLGFFQYVHNTRRHARDLRQGRLFGVADLNPPKPRKPPLVAVSAVFCAIWFRQSLKQPPRREPSRPHSQLPPEAKQEPCPGPCR